MLTRLAMIVMATASAAMPRTVTAEDTVYAPKVGQVHAEIVLPRIDTRESVLISQYRGKKVLLIHFASW